MYYRIKNLLDATLFIEEFWNDEEHKQLADRLMEIMQTLADNYGDDRGVYDYGGYVLIFTSQDDYEKYMPRIEKHFTMHPDYYEYKETIGEKVQSDGNEYREDLYLYSSEDALIVIHPRKPILYPQEVLADA